jgi:plasmid stabilization system protein ParE
MSYRVIYSERARSDLLNIERYISAAGSPMNAKAYVTAIVAKCESLAAAPHLGTRRDHLLPGLRTTGFRGRVTIAFRVTQQTVLIAGIFYGGRSLERVFKPSAEGP